MIRDEVFEPGAKTPDITRYAYDGRGLLARAESGGGLVLIERDKVGRVTAETINGRRMESVYNCCGDREERRIGGRLVKTLYDPLGALRELTVGDAAPLAFERDSRACLALKVARRINSLGVIEALADAMCLHGIPEYIRCDNGPEMISKALRKWVAKTGPQIRSIAPGSPWENGYCESFNGKLRDECLRQEIFYSPKDAQIVIGLWQNTDNRVRPHSSLGYRPPAPVSFSDLAFPLPMAAAMQ